MKQIALFAVLLCGISVVRSQEAPANPAPDRRYKADILLVVGHPDDDIEVASYVAKLVEQQHKRVAVVHATRGNAGGNAVGLEQASALAEVREIEARRAIASYNDGDVWFLDGSDTPGADVLRSLEKWGHGKSLDQMVRFVRLTRPEVIITHLPDYVVGENHEDHQAAGVLATEAFDLAGDPLAFPEQVEVPRDHLGIDNYGEGLRPWQPKKIYYFSDTTHFDFFDGNGPNNSPNDISPRRKIRYSQVAAEAWGFYRTQNDFTTAQLKEFTEMPVRLILGKSLVGGTRTGDVFEGIEGAPIRYIRVRGYEPPTATAVGIELGGPWAFYRAFWQAHDIGHLANLHAPEAHVSPGETLWVPILIHNDTDGTRKVKLRASLPPGWSQKPDAVVYRVEPHDSYGVQINIGPARSPAAGWENLRWSAESDGKAIGAVELRVSVSANGLPQ